MIIIRKDYIIKSIQIAAATSSKLKSYIDKKKN